MGDSRRWKFSYVVAFSRTASDRCRDFLTPFPAEDKGMVLTAVGDVAAMFHEHVADTLFGVGGTRSQLREAVNDILNEVETVHLVQHNHVEGRGGGALLFITANVNIPVIRAPVSQAMN